MTACIPTPGDCTARHADHWCELPSGHWVNPDWITYVAAHWCSCGVMWEVDAEAELAQVLYLAHWTKPFLDAPEAPPPAAVLTAALPGSHWRIVARAAMGYLGVA